MNALIAGLVAGAVSLIVTFGKVFWDNKQKKQEQRVAARESLDRYREPLLAAADDLGSRINNIRNDGFLTYFDINTRKRTALLGTVFRFAQFFGWTEIVYGSYGRLRFENDESTKEVADVLKSIGSTLASDTFDRQNENDFRTTRLMIWREEQRAIGEGMRVEGEPPRCLSFDSFVREYQSRFLRWFESFASQLDPALTPGSPRLAELQRLLARLVEKLDVDQILVTVGPDGVLRGPRWAVTS